MLKLKPDSEMDSDPGVDSDPTWIRIHAIPILALLDVIPVPDLDPQKSGIITPLVPRCLFRSLQKWRARNVSSDFRATFHLKSLKLNFLELFDPNGMKWVLLVQILPKNNK